MVSAEEIVKKVTGSDELCIDYLKSFGLFTETTVLCRGRMRLCVGTKCERLCWILVLSLRDVILVGVKRGTRTELQTLFLRVRR